MSEVNKTYQRRSADQWQTLIEEQTSSGLSQKAFCDTRRVSVSSFYAAKQRLASSDHETSDSDFVAIDLGPDPAGASCGWQLEVALGKTITLRFNRT